MGQRFAAFVYDEEQAAVVVTIKSDQLGERTDQEVHYGEDFLGVPYLDMMVAGEGAVAYWDDNPSLLAYIVGRPAPQPLSDPVTPT